MKINFTKEHQSRLEALAVMLLFAAIEIKGRVSTSMNVYQLIHQTSINTLRNMLTDLKKAVDNIKGLDKWSMNKAQQNHIDSLNVQFEFVELLIGYKLYQEQLAAERAEIRKMKADYLELKKQTTPPEKQMEALKAKLEKFGESVEDEAEETQAPAPAAPEIPDAPPAS